MIQIIASGTFIWLFSKSKDLKRSCFEVLKEGSEVAEAISTHFKLIFVILGVLSILSDALAQFLIERKSLEIWDCSRTLRFFIYTVVFMVGPFLSRSNAYL